MTFVDLPIHPITGLKAVGLLRNGAPVWPVLGGADDADDVVIDDTDSSSNAGEVDDDSAEGKEPRPAEQADDDEPLREAGTKALQAEKERRRESDRARRTAIRERDEALAELERLRKAAEKKAASTPQGGEGASADAPDLDAIRAEAAEQAKAALKAEVLKDRVSDKIEVLAAKRVQDPDVVRTLLLAGNDIADFLDGDKIDAEAIKEALDELLEKKPYLAVAAQSAKRFQGSGDGGARKGPQKPAQLTEDDLRRMSPEQIVQAQGEGRFDDLLGVSR
ncbi:hypothetical protein ACFYY8_31580 [Streptosporangium sp. NPDC001559]|uniref:hypothetical protein n=1 Tax=Streptosporangium sp. NPDC001559 TaxID=3366187 RepID=UPI0036E8199C